MGSRHPAGGTTGERMVLKGTPLEPLMPERIRKRRQKMNLSGADLARLVGVTPAYVSQIENGKRVPDVKVALAIARALDDDEELYSAWSRDFKISDRGEGGTWAEGAALTSLFSSSRFEGKTEFQATVRSGEDIPPPRGRQVDAVVDFKLSPPTMSPSMRHPVLERPAPEAGFSPTPRARSGGSFKAVLFDAAEEPAGSVEGEVEKALARAESQGRSLVSAPVLRPGDDPGEEDEIPQQLRIDRMVLDPRFLPSARLGRPFVFRADVEVARRVPDRVEQGDLVIVSRDLAPGGLGPEQVYALRLGGRIVLGRVARVGDSFLVLPAPGRTEMEDLGLVAGRPLKPSVAGEVVAVLKVGPR